MSLFATPRTRSLVVPAYDKRWVSNQDLGTPNLFLGTKMPALLCVSSAITVLYTEKSALPVCCSYSNPFLILPYVQKNKRRREREKPLEENGSLENDLGEGARAI